MKTLDRAISICESPAKLAGRMGIEPARVNMWVLRKRVPAGQALALERATDGEVTAMQVLTELERLRKRKRRNGSRATP